jgi:hypothetical protein
LRRRARRRLLFGRVVRLLPAPLRLFHRLPYFLLRLLHGLLALLDFLLFHGGDGRGGSGGFNTAAGKCRERKNDDELSHGFSPG